MLYILKRELKATLQGITVIPRANLSVYRKVFSLLSKKEKTLALLLLIFASLTPLLRTKSSDNKATTPNTTQRSYKEGIVGVPEYFNPVLASTNAERSISALTARGLYSYNEHSELIPELATTLPELSSNNKEYTIHLKPNQLWQDGSLISADDVLFTFNLVKNPEIKSPYYSFAQNTEIEKIDESTVKFKTKGVSAPFIHNLTLPLISKAHWGEFSPSQFKDASKNINNIFSNGPYQLSSESSSPNHIIFKSNNYSSSHPLILNVELVFFSNVNDSVTAFDSKQIDSVSWISTDTSPTRQPIRQHIQTYHFPIPQYQVIFFNNQARPFNDKRLRQALKIATDKQEILTIAHENAGSISAGPLVPEQLGYIKATTSTSTITEAGILLDKAGWKKDETGFRTKNLTPLSVKIATDFNPRNVKTAQILKKQWSNLNINVEIETYSIDKLLDNVIRPRNFDILLFSQKIDADPDPFAFWHSSQIADPGLNFAGFANPQADSDIIKGRTTFKEADRIKAYQDFQKVITEEAPAIFLIEDEFVFIADEEIGNISTTTLWHPSNRLLQLPIWTWQ